MKRQALIIGCPDNKILGVYDDMKNYKAFFESRSGGQWYSNEIITLQNPSKVQVQNAIEDLKKVDYSVVIFAGHGGYDTAKRTTILQLSPSVEIEEYELKKGAKRHTTIIDACRVLVERKIEERLVKGSMTMDSFSEPRNTRQIFDEHIKKTPEGLGVMYSCSITEGAGDIPGKGGTYSSTLIDVSYEWSDKKYVSNKGDVLTISDAHELAAPIVSRQRGGRQNPIAEFPRSLPRFPFSVSL